MQVLQAGHAPCAQAHRLHPALLARLALRPRLERDRRRRRCRCELAGRLHQPHLFHLAPVLRNALRPLQLILADLGLHHGAEGPLRSGNVPLPRRWLAPGWRCLRRALSARAL